MSGTLNRVEVIINKETYVLKGSDSTEYMEMLASRLDSRIAQVQDMNPRLGVYQTVMLAALNVLDEYLKLQQEHQRLLDLLDEPKKQ